MSAELDTLRSASRRLARRFAVLVIAPAAIMAGLVIGLVVVTQHHAMAQQLVSAEHVDSPRDAPLGTYIAIVRHGSTVASDDAPDGFPDTEAINDVSAHGGTILENRDFAGEAFTVRTDAGSGQVVQVAVSRREDQAELRRVVLAVGVAGIPTVAGAVLLGWWMSVRAMRPLADALALQRRFVADAGHELRTPLTLLSTRAQMLRVDVGSEAPDKDEVAAELDEIVGSATFSPASRLDRDSRSLSGSAAASFIGSTPFLFLVRGWGHQRGARDEQLPAFASNPLWRSDQSRRLLKLLLLRIIRLNSILDMTPHRPAYWSDPLPEAHPPAEMALYRVPTGTYSTRAAFAVAGGSFRDKRRFAATAVLIHHPKGDLLIDAGFGEHLFEHVQSLPRMERAPYEQKQTVAQQLEAAGYDRSHLLGVLVTHVHWDHVSGLDSLRVPVWLNKEEARYAAEDSHGTVFRTVSAGLEIREYGFTGPAYLGFPSRFDFYGDGSVVVALAGGHTFGSVVVFVTLPSAQRYAFIGDLTWQMDGILRGAERPWLLRRVADADASLVRLGLQRSIALSRLIHIVPAHDVHAYDPIPPLPNPFPQPAA